MAKKEENKPVVITAENVVEEARKGNTLTSDLKEKMDAELKDEKDKRIIAEVKRRYAKIAYNVSMGYVNLRKMRRHEQIALYNMRQQGRLQRFLCGFVVTDQIVTEFAKTPDEILEFEKLDEKKKVLIISMLQEDGKTRKETEFKVGDTVPAVIDYTEFDKGLIKLKEILNKKIKETNAAFDEEAAVIKTAAGEYWRSDWAYDIRIITSDAEAQRGSVW